MVNANECKLIEIVHSCKRHSQRLHKFRMHFKTKNFTSATDINKLTGKTLCIRNQDESVLFCNNFFCTINKQSFQWILYQWRFCISFLIYNMYTLLSFIFLFIIDINHTIDLITNNKSFKCLCVESKLICKGLSCELMKCIVPSCILGKCNINYLFYFIFNVRKERYVKVS